MPKFRINLISDTEAKPPLAEFDEATKSWIIKTSYPDPDSLAGSALVFSADGSISQLTFDEQGYIIREVNVKRKET